MIRISGMNININQCRCLYFKLCSLSAVQSRAHQALPFGLSLSQAAELNLKISSLTWLYTILSVFLTILCTNYKMSILSVPSTTYKRQSIIPIQVLLEHWCEKYIQITHWIANICHQCSLQGIPTCSFNYAGCWTKPRCERSRKVM